MSQRSTIIRKVKSDQELEQEAIASFLHLQEYGPQSGKTPRKLSKDPHEARLRRKELNRNAAATSRLRKLGKCLLAQQQRAEAQRQKDEALAHLQKLQSDLAIALKANETLAASFQAVSLANLALQQEIASLRRVIDSLYGSNNQANAVRPL